MIRSGLNPMPNIGLYQIKTKRFTLPSYFTKNLKNWAALCKFIDTNTNPSENLTMTATVELTLPDSVHLSDSDLKMILAAKLFEMGELSSGQASKMVGITRREFLESVGKYGVSIFQYDADELEEDLERLRK